MMNRSGMVHRIATSVPLGGPAHHPSGAASLGRVGAAGHKIQTLQHGVDSTGLLTREMIPCPGRRQEVSSNAPATGDHGPPGRSLTFRLFRALFSSFTTLLNSVASWSSSSVFFFITG